MTLLYAILPSPAWRNAIFFQSKRNHLEQKQKLGIVDVPQTNNPIAPRAADGTSSVILSIAVEWVPCQRCSIPTEYLRHSGDLLILKSAKQNKRLASRREPFSIFASVYAWKRSYFFISLLFDIQRELTGFVSSMATRY